MNERPSSPFDASALAGRLQNSMFRTNPHRRQPRPRLRAVVGLVVGIGLLALGGQALQGGRVGATTASVAVSSENIAISDDPAFLPAIDSSLAEAAIQTGVAELVSCEANDDDQLQMIVSVRQSDDQEYDFSEVLVTYESTDASGKHLLVVGATNGTEAETFTGIVPGDAAGLVPTCKVVSVIGYVPSP